MLLDDLSSILYAGSFGLVCSSGDYNIWKGRSPEAPDRVIVLQEYGGEPPYHTMASGPGQCVLETSRVQVFVRSANYSSGRQKMNAIWKGLDQYQGTVNGIPYYLIEALQSPVEMPRDANERARFVCNFRVMKGLST